MPKAKQTTTTKTEAPTVTPKMPRDMAAAFGKPGEVFVSTYYNEEKRIDNLKISDYRQMVDNDGLIQMLWNAITNTIMSAGFQVIDDEDFEGEEESEEHEFIERVLFQPPWKGGMATSFDHVSRIMLRAFVEGFRVFEVIYKVAEDGKIVLSELAPRAGKTDSEFYLIIDPSNGRFIGFRQKVQYLNNVTDVIVKNEGAIKKVVKATYGEEFGSTYGRSGLRPAWYHYDKAHKGMYLLHVGLELGAVKYRNYKHNLSNADQVTEIVNSLAKIGVESVGAFKQADGELFFEDVADAAVMGVGKEMVLLHYAKIAQSMLAQFSILGSSGESGNRALGESQTEFFKEGLQALATIIIERTWNEVIADLVKVNFNRGIYPTLRVNPIAGDKSDTLYEVFTEMVKGNKVSDTLLNELQGVVADKLDLDVSKEQIVEDMEAQKEEKAAEKQAESDMQMQQAKMRFAAKPNIKLDDTQADISVMSRPLYPDEEKVKIVDIRRKLMKAERDAEDIMRRKLEEQRNGIVEQYVKASREGRKAITNVKIELAENKYSDELLLIAQEMFNYGKIQAANEIDKPVPATSRADEAALIAAVTLGVQDQASRLMFQLTTVANNALQGNLAENQTRLLLEQEFDAFWNNRRISGTAELVVPESLNKGRKVTFDRYQKDIYAYRYTAVLDGNTTTYCRKMDGRVFQSNDPEYIMTSPPNHFGCRSIWTPILQTEKMGVRVNGKPNDLPVYGSVSSFKDVDMADIKQQLDQLLNNA